MRCRSSRLVQAHPERHMRPWPVRRGEMAGVARRHVGTDGCDDLWNTSLVGAYLFWYPALLLCPFLLCVYYMSGEVHSYAGRRLPQRRSKTDEQTCRRRELQQNCRRRRELQRCCRRDRPAARSHAQRALTEPEPVKNTANRSRRRDGAS